MLWPVLLDDPPTPPWSLGHRVTTRLRWLDRPGLPADLTVHAARVRTGPLAGGHPWAHLVEAGDLRAVRQGALPAGDLSLDGCLGCDAFLPLIAGLPATVAVVRRIQVLHVHSTGALRRTDVPDTGAPEAVVEGDPGPGRLQFLSPEQYHRLQSERSPWQARGWLVHLDVGP